MNLGYIKKVPCYLRDFFEKIPVCKVFTDVCIINGGLPHNERRVLFRILAGNTLVEMPGASPLR